MGRSAIVTSPNTGGLALYWITFGLMAGSAVCFAIITAFKPAAHRHHGYITTLIVAIAASAYFAMAAGGGDDYFPVYYNNAQSRDIFWARYVDWFLTTPLLLLDLLILTDITVATTLWIMAADIFMIVFGLFGAVSDHKTKWGWFGVACFFEALIVVGLILPGMKGAFARGKSTGMLFAIMAVYLSVLWWGYPIVWGLAEGSNTISADAEIAAYAGLDIVAKVVFGWIIMLLGYPMIGKQMNMEHEQGRFLPQLLSSPINAPLSIVPTGPKAYHPVGKSNPGGPMETSTGAPTGSPVPAGATSASAGTKAPGANGQTIV